MRLQQAFGAYHVQLISPSTPTATLSFSLKKNHNINLNNYFSNGVFFLTNIYTDLNLTHGIAYEAAPFIGIESTYNSLMPCYSKTQNSNLSPLILYTLYISKYRCFTKIGAWVSVTTFFHVKFNH